MSASYGSEDYFCRNSSAGALSLVAGTHHSSGATDDGNEADHNDASSTENYEPLDFKAWRSQQQRPSAEDDVDDEEEEEDEEEYNSARASLTVELGPATSAPSSAVVTGPDYITQAVRSAK